MIANVLKQWMLLTYIYLMVEGRNYRMQMPPQFPPTNGRDGIGNNEQFMKMMGDPNYRWSQSQEQSQSNEEQIDVRAEAAKLNISYSFQSSWPDPKRQLGTVSAVSFDKYGNVVIFQRGDHIWDANTFNGYSEYIPINDGPITDNTVIGYDRRTGQVVYEWGKNIFYMPHGFTHDIEDNAWITDVGLHQIMKFGVDRTSPLLTLGTKFKPGRSRNLFCKPTAVAVLDDGDFFVSDGYCNARILKFSKSGEFLIEWGQNSFQGVPYDVSPPNYFAIPHALTLLPDKGLLCVADRENGRVQCFHTQNGTFHSQYHNPIIGDRLFSVAYTPINGGQLLVVNGPLTTAHTDVLGFVIDMKTGKILSKFGANNTTFQNPHDIIVSEDGSEVYVAELSPTRVYKFIDFNLTRMPPIITKPTATLDDDDPLSPLKTINVQPKTDPGATALLVVALIVIFAILMIGLSLLIARRRKRGCVPFGSRNRRHAWDFPSGKSDGFKLGHLLDRKRGFEKVNQDASDEEPNASTNMLTSAQFA